MELFGEVWRYGIISRGMRVPNRPKDWFSLDQYVAVRMEETHLPGRVIDVIGDHPPIIKVCVFQGRKLCRDHFEGCKPSCRKHLFTTADHAGVLSLGDLLFVLENPEPLNNLDPRNNIPSHQAEQLFGLIDKLEARQKSC